MKEDVNRFADHVMHSIKSDFMFRAKSGRTTYTMEEILWIVHENIAESVNMYDYYDGYKKNEPDIRHSQGCSVRSGSDLSVFCTNGHEVSSDSMKEYYKEKFKDDGCDE